MNLTGIHHVSGLTADARKNLVFYTRTLGLRLVKKTVNQDNTSAYHLFYGDERGQAGTEVTFFDIADLGRNHPGVGTVSNVALRVPSRESLGWWQDRFDQLGVTHGALSERAGRSSLGFRDPEGQSLQLVEDGGAPGGTPWARSPVPTEVGIKGLGPVSLTVREAAPTAGVLTEVLNFREGESYGLENDDAPGAVRVVRVFVTGPGGAGAEVHLLERPDLPVGHLGRGGMHHVAFRVPNEEEHRAWLGRLTAAGVPNSGWVDRYYFRSIYFREPNGVLFELATDGPGFATDEDPDRLGERLALPPFLESQRAQIEARLRPLDPVDPA